MSDFATRAINAHEGFIDDLRSQFGLSRADAETVLRVFRREKVVKLDPVMGRYMLKHGAFWSEDVIRFTITEEGYRERSTQSTSRK